MLGYVWAGMILVSVVYGLCTGGMEGVGSGVMTGGENAVGVCMTLAGILMVWNGFMRIAERAGITKLFGRLLKPILHVLFPGLSADSPAAGAMSMNIAANVLGLGNAATPLGIEAMRRLADENPLKTTASNHMITFVVLNTASIQLVPTTIAAMRAARGAAAPMDVLLPILFASVLSLLVGLLVCAFACLRPAGRAK